MVGKSTSAAIFITRHLQEKYEGEKKKDVSCVCESGTGLKQDSEMTFKLALQGQKVQERHGTVQKLKIKGEISLRNIRRGMWSWSQELRS